MKNPVLAANVRKLRLHLGLKQDAFAIELGATQSSVSKWETKGDKPEAIPLERMARRAGCSIEEFINEPWTPPRSKSPQSDNQPTRSADAGETASIIALDLSLSMGPGTPIEDFVESEPVEFDISLLRSITRSPYSRLRVVRGIGSSMEPKFYTGDRVLVDTTERSLGRLDGYYWITLFGAHGLKKLRPVGKRRVLVISENPADDNQEVDVEDLTIEGRAIWLGRDL